VDGRFWDFTGLTDGRESGGSKASGAAVEGLWGWLSRSPLPLSRLLALLAGGEERRNQAESEPNALTVEENIVGSRGVGAHQVKDHRGPEPKAQPLGHELIDNMHVPVAVT
jgi:hypothetical protein